MRPPSDLCSDGMDGNTRSGAAAVSLAVLAGPPGSGRGDAVLAAFRDVAGARAGPRRADQRRRRPPRARALRRPRRDPRRDRDQLPGAVRRGREVGGPRRPSTGLSAMQRIWLARAAAAEAPLRRLSRSARREGSRPPWRSCSTDLQASGLDAPRLRRRRRRGRRRGLRARARRAVRSLRVASRSPRARRRSPARRANDRRAPQPSPGSWAARPVFLYGFDDLTREQVELVGALADGLRGDGRR